jgi:hypothetical protein
MADVSRHPLEGKLTQEQQDHIMTLSPDGIAAYLHELEVAAGLRVHDAMNPSVLHEVEQPVAQSQTASVTVAGKTFSGTQAEIDQQLLAYFRSQQAQPAGDGSPRDSNGRFTREPSMTDSADQVAGDLVTKGIKGYLAEQGIDPDALREASALMAHQKAWAHATREFLNGDGSGYPGGEALQEEMGKKLIELGLDNYPSAANLKKAWDAVQDDAVRFVRLRDAKSRTEIDEALGRNQRGVVSGGGLWNL